MYITRSQKAEKPSRHALLKRTKRIKKKRKKVSRRERERAFLGQHLRLRDLAGQLTFRRRSIEKHPRHKRRKLSRRSVMCGNEKEEEEEENIFRCVYKLLFNDRTKQRRVDTTFFFFSFFVCIPNRSESLERFLPKKKKERKDAKEREREHLLIHQWPPGP